MKLSHEELRKWGEALDKADPHGPGGRIVQYADAWRDEIAAAAKEEREACALICEDEQSAWKYAQTLQVLCLLLASKIRSRTNE